MKVVYNNKEIINNTNNYNELLNRPMINSRTLQGATTLSDINAYSKAQIDELIGQSRSIEIVNALPTNLIENTLYYVGPDANDFYTVYLVDEVRNVFEIGTSQFGEYFAGTGVNIDSDNYITTKIDNKTIIVDDDNNLHANLDMDSVPVMVGATSSTDGEKGLVTQPQIGDNLKCLRGDATWQYIINFIYPVGSIYITLNNVSPSTFLPGTTWSKLSTGRALWSSASGGGSTLSAAVPNINKTTGNTVTRAHQSDTNLGTGALRYIYAGGFGAISGTLQYGQIGIDASQGTYKLDGTKMTSDETPFGKSTTVQPKAIKVCMWRRTA